MTTSNNYDVGVIGLGYVGLTLATVLAEVGFKTVGVEKRPEVVELTNACKPHFFEPGLEKSLSRVTRSGHLTAVEQLEAGVTCGIYIITVGTPLGADGVIRLDMIESASRQVSENMRSGALVIIRSTVKTGTTRNVVTPILAASGKEFDIAMCPERTLEGKALQELRELPQIVGADTQDVRDRAGALFNKITNTIIHVETLETAELIKLVDNTFRDVQFAFANEVARVCEAFGVNAAEVVTSGKLGYKRTNVPLPGLVGGPCLEKDPHILSQGALEKGLVLEITQASRLVNERQPRETIDFVNSEMTRRGIRDEPKVAILGMAFKGVPATDDLRGAMSLKVLDALTQVRPDARVHLFDPVIPADKLAVAIPGHFASETFEEAVRDAAVVIIANNHPDLGGVPPIAIHEIMAPNGFIYDYWNHFSNLKQNELGDFYFAVGNRRTKS